MKKKQCHIKDSKYGPSREAIKTIFNLFHIEKMNTFEIKEYLNENFEEKISLNDISKILSSNLSKLYKTVNIDKK